MIKNSQRRKSVRRQSAFKRRSDDLSRWESLAHSDPENKSISEKLDTVKLDLTNLKKKLGNFG